MEQFSQSAFGWQIYKHKCMEAKVCMYIHTDVYLYIHRLFSWWNIFLFWKLWNYVISDIYTVCSLHCKNFEVYPFQLCYHKSQYDI